VRRRLILLTAAIPLLLMLALPVVAQAGTTNRWSVKDTKGHVRGVAFRDYSGYRPPYFMGRVYNSSGSEVGFSQCEGSTSGSMRNIGLWLADGSGGQGIGFVKLGTDRHSALIYPYAAAPVIGRAVLRDARWSIQKRSGGAYHSVGWVPSRCPVTFAAAAGRILLW